MCLNQLLEPTFTSPNRRINLRRWNKNAEEYATRTGERVSDGIRRAVYMNKIASQDMRQHLMLNQSRLRTPEEVAQEIEDCWDATEEFSRDDKGQAGFIAPTLERETRRVKEKCAKRSDSNPSVVSRDVLEDTAIGVGELVTKNRSVGSNKNIQRAIHHKTRHKETFANGQTQRRKSKLKVVVPVFWLCTFVALWIVLWATHGLSSRASVHVGVLAGTTDVP